MPFGSGDESQFGIVGRLILPNTAPHWQILLHLGWNPLPYDVEPPVFVDLAATFIDPGTESHADSALARAASLAQFSHGD